LGWRYRPLRGLFDDDFAYKVSAGYFDQPAYDRPTGPVPGSNPPQTYPGFTNKGTTQRRANVRFVERLLDWWSGNLNANVDNGRAVELLHSIEVGLYDIVLHVLKQHFPEAAWWYEGVPEPLRKKAADLSEESKGSIPKEQGFYFISYKLIMEENWKIFEPVFDPAKEGKKKALVWIQTLNDLRNRLSHPLRLREQPLSSGDQFEIDRRKRLVDQISSNLHIKIPKNV